MRPGWWATLVAIAVAPVIVLLIVDNATTTDVDRTIPTHPAITVTYAAPQTADIKPTTATYIQTVTFRADRTLHVTGLDVVYCPGSCGSAPKDPQYVLQPPDGVSLDLGTTARTLTFQGVLPQRAYSEYVRYRQRGGAWQNLPPYRSV